MRSMHTIASLTCQRGPQWTCSSRRGPSARSAAAPPTCPRARAAARCSSLAGETGCCSGYAVMCDAATSAATSQHLFVPGRRMQARPAAVHAPHPPAERGCIGALAGCPAAGEQALVQREEGGQQLKQRLAVTVGAACSYAGAAQPAQLRQAVAGQLRGWEGKDTNTQPTPASHAGNLAYVFGINGCCCPVPSAGPRTTHPPAAGASPGSAAPASAARRRAPRQTAHTAAAAQRVCASAGGK